MRINLKSALFSVPIAHRGLWLNKTENSLYAYSNAIENGFPIEIDLYSSTDGVLYCFHDKDLFRMTGVHGYIYEKNSAFINKLFIGNGEKIPTFEQVLQLVSGKVPLLIEIKNQPDKLIVERVLACLNDYVGEYAIQSFNPLYLYRLKKLAPNVLRGILATADQNDLKNENPLIKLIIKNMLLNFLIKPDFISYNYNGVPLPKRKTKNKAILVWTVTSPEIFHQVKPYCDNVIFENFIPKT